MNKNMPLSQNTPKLFGKRPELTRRGILLSGTAVAITACANWGSSSAAKVAPSPLRSELLTGSPFGGLDLASDWEGLNQGYWRQNGESIRRRMRAYGDRARDTGFPYHYESQANPEGLMPTEYDPSLPLGIMWNRHWKLSPNYSLSAKVTVHTLSSIVEGADDPNWAMYQSGFGLFGISFGGQSQFESFFPSKDASPLFLVKENGEFGFYKHTSSDLESLATASIAGSSGLQPGDKIEIVLTVQPGTVSSILTINGTKETSVSVELDKASLSGYYGIAARGLLDVSIDSLELEPFENKPIFAPLNDCHVCYALGDTLEETPAGWKVRFVALFRTSGDIAEIRVSDLENPELGWSNVPIAGSAKIISNEFRCNTAIIDVTLPRNPAETTLYYVIGKDGVDVTKDPRLGTDSVGPGTGLVGDVPSSGGYIGRLPRLKAPYRLAGLSCHAINTASYTSLTDELHGRCGGRIVGQPDVKAGNCSIDKPLFVHDQPCRNAFAHIEEFDYQIMLWEDDIWYLELLLYPPSTEDAYKIITTSIAGPTTRWQMMRHWNVLNPGDHDHGMDDVKGPEQILIRNRDDLGQDPDYMVRNFQIVSHLMTGKEDPSGKDNPKRWRKWKMPDRDFSLLIADSRLWRTSQDTAIWDDEGWDVSKELYSRTDPTRVLLGEEQFSWLSQQLKTDSSSLICVTGINVLHTIWGGHGGNDWLNEIIDRDRVSADYAGWVKAGADRILDLISARPGVVTVYGDVHAGSIVRNKDLNVFECSFGPIGRWGGRSLIEGFGRDMLDADGRPVECICLYHHEFEDPDLAPASSRQYWNILEAVFDPMPDDAQIELRIRNIMDTPSTPPRGGGDVAAVASSTGRQPSSRLPEEFTTLPNSDVLILTPEGVPIQGARTNASGKLKLRNLIGPRPSDEVLILANDGEHSRSSFLTLREV